MGGDKIHAVYMGGMQFSTMVKGHSVTIDLKEANGGNNLGTSPKALMLVSLAGCTGVDVVSILNKMKVDFTDFSIDVEASLTDEHPKIYQEVTVIYTIRVAKKNEIQVEKAVNLSQEKYCGVSEMFRAFARLSSTITYLS